MGIYMDDNSGTKQTIINTAKSFFYSVGYRKTSIQKIIDTAGIAKGTFYHYFKSKEDLLNQFIDSEMDALHQQLNVVLEMDIGALEKMSLIYKSGASWKAENVAAMRPLMKIMISDENIVLRHTMLQHQIKKISPIYETIIRQGRDEGVFNVQDPTYTAQFIVNSFSAFADSIYGIFATPKYTEEVLMQFRNFIKYFEDTMERLLGTEKGSIKMIDDNDLELLIKGLLEA